MNRSLHFLALWEEGRTRFSKLIADIKEEDLAKILPPAPNSAGFLIRHIGDVELLVAKNIFKAASTQVHAKTVIAQKDTGEWTNLQELLLYQQQAYSILKQMIQAQAETSWQETVTAKEFGTKTKAEALGRIVTHTAYHEVN
jgi:DinB superfamily